LVREAAASGSLDGLLKALDGGAVSAEAPAER